MCFGLGALLAPPAWASHVLGPTGERIDTSDYALDLYQGPVFAGTRVTGLAGAYVAVAEDVDGNLQNPATPAVRSFYSIEPFDYGLGFGLTFPGTLRNMDFFNTGSTTEIFNSPTSFVFMTPALNLQFGTFGAGVTFEYQSYSISSSEADPDPTNAVSSMRSLITTTHVQAANAFFDGQLVAGLGGRIVVMRVDNRSILSTPFDVPFSTVGTGLEFGVLWRPSLQPFRLGASYRSQIEAEAVFSRGFLPNEYGHIVIELEDSHFYLPERVQLPWDLNLGAAVQFGRELNARFRTVDDAAERDVLEHRLRQIDREAEFRERRASARSAAEKELLEREFEREQARDDARLELRREQVRRGIERSNTGRDRFYALLSGSVVVSGGAESAVGIESFISQKVNRARSEVVFSPRLGVETELWPEHMKVRLGNYLEPARFDTSRPRVHQTLGVDVSLPVWDVFGFWPDDYRWRLSGTVDAARDYLVWGVSVGGWYPRQRREQLDRTAMEDAL